MKELVVEEALSEAKRMKRLLGKRVVVLGDWRVAIKLSESESSLTHNRAGILGLIVHHFQITNEELNS